MLCRCKVIPLKYGYFVSAAVRHNLFVYFPTDLCFYMKSVVYIVPVATLGTEEYGKGTKMVQLIYANQGWRCTSPTLSEHLCSTRSVWVFKCARKVHKRHACSTQKVSSRYQAVNHLRDYFSWFTSHRQAQFLADLYLS